MSDTKVDIMGRTPVIGDTIVFPYTSTEGRRRLRKGIVVNIGKKGNPVAKYTKVSWRRSPEIKRAITTDFIIID